jgi:hypothetical protein
MVREARTICSHLKKIRTLKMGRVMVLDHRGPDEAIRIRLVETTLNSNSREKTP